MARLPTPEELRALLRYEPETGRLFWRERPPEMFATPRAFSTWTARFAGKEAMTAINNYGYRFGTISGRPHLAHRVAWTITSGAWPDAEIDHINGVRTDNRITNLREADRRANARNVGRRLDNSSGCTGVQWHAHSKKWLARIKVNYRQFYLGTFERREDAIAARKAAEVKHGFHENHGRPQ
jgi:hypothetical protein